MRCTQCDYTLWNLRARQCPECGAAFTPSSYRFLPNAVRFTCPHCNQAYYGTSEKGLLDPPEFECVCGRWIHMDEMVLLPAEGIADHATMPDSSPWLDRGRKGFFSSWLRTVWAALITPHRVVRDGASPGSTGQAWWFAIITLLATTLATFLPFALFVLIILGFGGGPAGFTVFLSFGFFFALSFGLWLLSLAIWGPVTHGLLRLTGPTSSTIGRTYQALCYSSGANIASAIPCLGWYFGWIWWVVSATIMTATAQRVSGPRAAFAVLTFPLALAVILVASYFGFMIWMTRTMGPLVQQAAMMATDASTTSRMFASGLTTSAGTNGTWPAHAAVLISEGLCAPEQFIVNGSATPIIAVRIGGTSLVELGAMPVVEQAAAAAKAAAELPDGTIAHRVGDHVFTYHGAPRPSGARQAPENDLWLVIVWLDPDWNETGAVDGQVWVGTNTWGFASHPIPIESFDEAIDAQNDLRRSLGLPPLPHPREVLHGKIERESAN